MPAHRWRLISDRLENIARSPEASNKYPVRKLFRIISVFDIVFLSRIAYTINAQKARKRGEKEAKTIRSDNEKNVKELYDKALTLENEAVNKAVEEVMKF